MFKRGKPNPNKLPAQVNVTQGVTYEVDKLMLTDISEAYGKELTEITIHDVMSWLEDWIAEDFTGGGMLTVTDERGKEIHA
jgi:hypothetical protein